MKSMLGPLICLLCNVGMFHSSKATSLAVLKPERTYAQSKSKIDSLKKVCRTKKRAQAGKVFAKYIDKQLFPYWFGTRWDYNGVSQTPGKGNVACGYFVTTVLRDAGVKINRIKMAQCASELMINSLTKNKVNYSGLPFASFLKKVKSKGEGIAIIGLDYHTGFLYNDGKELWFIHSSFVKRKGVVNEKASTNNILYHSKYKVVGFISQDAVFIRRWLQY